MQTSRGKTFSSFTRGGRPIIFLVGNPRGLRKRRANFEARKGGATTESPVTMEAIELCFGEEIEEVARTLRVVVVWGLVLVRMGGMMSDG